MKKIIICLLALCLVLSFGVACGDKSTDSGASDVSTSGGNISVIGGSSDTPSDTSSTDESATSSSEPTASEILDWWGNVSLEIE